ncbi:hypothetical protein, partial [Absiella sp. AM27-20]|uniref:hypothetical protein n=1 Tax=Absiella sp. AM27-20 TaxID=2292277 RepID=UPI001F20A1CC
AYKDYVEYCDRKNRNKKKEKTRNFHIAAFTLKGCTACIPTYLLPLKLESSACFWIKRDFCQCYQKKTNLI